MSSCVKKKPKHNDAYLERIAQDLIRLQYWFEGYQAGNPSILSIKTLNAVQSLHHAMMIVREAKEDEHSSKGVSDASINQ